MTKMTKVTGAEKGQEIEVKETQEIQKPTPTRALYPFEEMELLFNRMERLFESIMPRSWLRPRDEWPSWREFTAPLEGWLPRVDVIEHDEEIVVQTELPRVDKKDLDVSITGDRLTIKGITRHDEKAKKGDYHCAELPRGAFTRTLLLPAEVDSANAKATFNDGILELILPKVTGSKRRTINVA